VLSFELRKKSNINPPSPLASADRKLKSNPPLADKNDKAEIENDWRLARDFIRSGDGLYRILLAKGARGKEPLRPVIRRRDNQL
jgi:hypothetical protein